MRIVYGVSGEGFGHVIEARGIIPVLRRDGHEVLVLTYGDRACEALAEHHPLRIEGLPLHFTDRGLSIRLTLARNAHVFPFYLRHSRRLMREITAFRPDVFLTAFEPFTTAAAHWLHRPLVSMDNQRALLSLRSTPPGHRFACAVAKLATRIVTAGADAYLIKTLDPARPVGGRSRFVAPIVQAELRALAPTVGNHVLVYLTKPNPDLLGVLRQVDARFVVYSREPERTDGNLEFHRQGPGFLTHLASCRAIVATAGFSLIADALFLKKPYFAVPLKGQFEQTLNAFQLAASGLGEQDEAPDRARIEAFLGRLPLYRERLARRSFDPAEQEEALRAVLRRLVPETARSVTGASPAFSPK